MTIELEFTPEELKELNYERYRHPLPLVQRRMEVLWLKAHGLPHAKIAELGNITENTMRDYFELYQEGGTEKLKEVNFYRPESQLGEHITSLEAYFLEHPPASVKEAQQKIKDIAGIERSETQIREFLKNTVFALPESRDDPGQSGPGSTGYFSGRVDGTPPDRSQSGETSGVFCRRRPLRSGTLPWLSVVSGAGVCSSS